MSSEIAIRVSNLSKCYHIYEKPADRLKQAIVPRAESLFGLGTSSYFSEFWALRDVSFEVKRGETVGIVGRNGSGKSTLLQMICGTLSPTAGTISVYGRIAALLELGSGFNPEFTGRENVFLNASILGITEDEALARFDRIVAFADIGEFIDRPVKTYSSGMLVRLAFSVIAHVDADILVIDEAFAVGDSFFVQKCMRFLRNFMKTGTLLLVTHDPGTLINLCERAVWLSQGKIVDINSAKNVADQYLKADLQDVYGQTAVLEENSHPKEVKLDVDEELETGAVQGTASQIKIVDNLGSSTGWRTGSGIIESVTFENADGKRVSLLAGGESVTLIIKARASKPIFSPILGFLVKDKLGQALFGENTFSHVPAPISLEAGGTCEARFAFEMPLLPNGVYAIAVSIAEGTPWENVQHHWLHEAVIFNVASAKLRYGLVGIRFQSVVLNVPET